MKKWLIVLVFLSSPAIADYKLDAQKKYDQCMSQMESTPAEISALCFEDVLKIDADSVSSMYYLGKLYLQSGSYAKSIDTFERLISLSPEDAWALNFYIDALIRSGDESKALATAEKASLRFPEYPGFYAYLVLLNQRARNLERVNEYRAQLFGLVSAGALDGLVSDTLYVRDRFSVGRNNAHVLEYFPSTPDAPYMVSFRVSLADGQQRLYRLNYNEIMKSAVKQEHGEHAEPYFLDAFDGSRQRLVTAFITTPDYEALRAVVIQDLEADGRSSRACVESPISKVPVPCPD